METNDRFGGKYNCSQKVAVAQAEKLGFDRDTMLCMAAPFGGGISRGEVCGAVCGAMLVVGLHYRHIDGIDTGAAIKQKVQEFNEKFIARNGSVVCRELLGYDFSKPGERQKALDSGVTREVCPKVIQDAIDILDEIL